MNQFRVVARPRPMIWACLALLLVALLPNAVAMGSWTREGAETNSVPRGGASLEEEPGAELAEDGHLVISELSTGGVSASDEFVEIYNPTPLALPLEGLELVYVTASGATVTRKAEWPAGSPLVPPGAHALVANEAGIFVTIADATYAGGLAATGGSMAIRVQGASSAVDAVGWGTAASSWLERQPAPAHAAGGSLERLPGGAAGSGQDTDDNALDFVERAAPDPQNSTSPPIPIGTSSPTPTASASATPSGSASPTPSPSPILTATPSPTPSPSPSPSSSTAPLTIAAARALPDGTIVTVEGVALSDESFADGGGCVADGTAGVAVLVDDGGFTRGQRLRVTGVLDDRYHQRTIRAQSSGIVGLGPATDPEPMQVTTGQIGEATECRVVQLGGTIVSASSQLTGAVAFDIDDGSGQTRLVVADAAGIDTGTWERGTLLELRGVAGQRDSGGTGMGGYRVMPRDPADVLVADHSHSASPSGSASPTAGTSASPAPGALVSIEDARRAPVNARLRIRGVVTLPTGLLIGGSASLQDGSGAIMLRIGDDQGQLALGELVEVYGMRSTFSGMVTVRVLEPPRRLGTQPAPAVARRATGQVGEADEALLLAVRGAITVAPRRTSAENVYFDLDDGSGPLRVYVSPRTGVETASLQLGSWLEVVGVLGQETTGQQPLRGYRLWPRTGADVRLVAAATGGSGSAEEEAGGSPGVGGGAGAGGAHGVELPLPPVGLAPPGLSAPRLALARPTVSPPPVAEAGAARRAPDAPVGAAAALSLAAAVLAGLGGVAAARPGLLGRLRKVLADRLQSLRGPGPAASEDDISPHHALHGFEPPAAGTVASAAARLLPLTVVEGGSAAPPSSGEGSQQERGRILPPI